MRCEWQVEIDPYCQRVLAKHWPSVRRWDDVRTFPPAGEWGVDVICGGFPCQDISNAGKCEGITGERSGLWTEYARIIRVLRPRYVVVENVAALLVRGMGTVLGDLAACGYDAEWKCVSAARVGAPHLRERVWIVAHDDRHDSRASVACQAQAGTANITVSGSESRILSNANGWNGRTGGARRLIRDCPRDAEQAQRKIPNTVSPRLAKRKRKRGHDEQKQPAAQRSGEVFSDADSESLGRIAESSGQRGQWSVEPAVGRVADGVPSRVDRLRGLGNAVVPQVAEWIGHRIVEATNEAS
jgi:DNA (cytosine-5)-methyltransferase 1